MSPGQINLQAPDDSALGVVTVVVVAPSGTAKSTVTLAQLGPSLNLFDSKYVAGVIPTPTGSGAYGNGTYDLVRASGHFAFSARPVKAGENLEFFGVGFGPTNPIVPAGRAFAGSAPTVFPVTVTIGGAPTTVLFSGMSSAGLYQFNVVVPNVGSGDKVLQMSVDGVQTPAGVFVTVQQ